MSEAIEAQEVSQLPALRSVQVERASVLLVPVMDPNTAKKRLQEFQDFCSSYLEEGIDADYGTIPGTKKKTLLKPGADKLAELYGLSDEYELMSVVEEWDKGLFDYKVKCILRSRRDDSLVGTGLGSCSSYESKYRWRESKRKCPSCGMEVIIKGKSEYGGGWLCWKKQGGCGTTFKDGDKAIEGQVIGRVQNDDIVDTKNTVLKMAKKRAKIDAIIGVTRSSGIFTQDFGEDDLPREKKSEPETIKEPQTFTKPAAEQVLSGDDNKGPSPRAAGSGECIEAGQSANFYKLFRDSLKPALRKQSDELAHEWLKKQGIVDATGAPSTLAIRKDSFYEVREAAIEHASKL